MPNKKKVPSWFIGLVIISILGMAACWILAGPINQGAFYAAIEPSPPTELHLLEATCITIQDDWMGISPASPIKARYVITQGDGYFGGQADFSIGWGDRKLAASDTFTIPQEAMASFLETLAGSQLEKWRFDGCIVADDYPDISITVSSNAKTVKFRTASSCKNYIPWTVEFNGWPYITNSPDPAQALRQLKLLMAPDTLENLIKQAKW